MRNISIFEYCISFYCFCTNTLENNCYSILLKRLNRMLDILKNDIIYYVIYNIYFYDIRKTHQKSHKPPFCLGQLKWIVHEVPTTKDYEKCFKLITGENIHALLKNIASSPKLADPGVDRHGEMVFFDVVGFFMVHYPKRIGTLINYGVVATALLYIIKKSRGRDHVGDQGLTNRFSNYLSDLPFSHYL